MTSLTKFGTVIRVVQVRPPQYEVRLDNQAFVIVNQSQIQPARSKPLHVGCRLAVYEIGGQVKWASTDLTSRKDALQDDMPITEITTATVVETDPGKGVVTFEGRNGEAYRIRLPISHRIWQQLFRGREFEIEITHRPGSSDKYSVVMPSTKSGAAPAKRPVPESAQVPPKEQGIDWWRRQSSASNTQTEERPPAQEVPKPSGMHSPEAGAGAESQKAPEAENVEGGRIGIDPAYFSDREQEGHRAEIMTFLADHLHDDWIEWYQMRAAKEARYAQPIKPLHPAVDNILRDSDGKRIKFYSHQARALDTIRAGRNLVVITPTASGKTLCYNPAIFESIIGSDFSARALYIFPLNALLMDQVGKIDGMRKELASRGISISSRLLIGGLGQSERKRIAKENPHILAINPEMLNWILQAEAQDWQAFLSNLKYVVVDEVHTHRGIQGLHMAGIIRRLLLQARRLGAEPQFILSSATVHNPKDLAIRLTSLPESSFDLLDEHDDGSQQAYKHWIVVNPDAHSTNGSYDTYLTVAALTMVELLNARDENGRPSPLNTILFAKSKRDVHKIFAIVQENLRNRPELARQVRQYASPELSIEEKKQIYEGLKSGQLRGVVSTNALEAGIDIGRLDACVIAGFPFTVMRMRQMAGRVGRSDEGLVAFVPHPMSPFDQYYRQNPELLLTQAPEVFVIDPGNRYVARKHINAAAYSLGGISQKELSIFGPNASAIVQEAEADGIMHRNGTLYSGTRRDYSNASDPYAINGIRSEPQIPYAVCKVLEGQQCAMSDSCLDANAKHPCRLRVAVLDRQYAYRDCHPGAVYEDMDGDLYRIVSFDDKRRVVRVVSQPAGNPERTFAEEETTIEIIGEPKAMKRVTKDVELAVGDVVVTRSFTGYYTYDLIPKWRCRHCRKDYEQPTPQCPLCSRRTSKHYDQSKITRHEFPPSSPAAGLQIKLKTVACWMKVPAELENQLMAASPCTLPGDNNRVMGFLKKPLRVGKLALSARLTDEEKAVLTDYHERSGVALRQRRPSLQESVLYPGVYGQCLLPGLRVKFGESRSLEIFHAATSYPVTDDLRHVCRRCQSTTLLPAMHTLEHTVRMRYPSVALGDLGDLESYSTLGHAGTGTPAIFWYDNYDGGLGAAEKIYDCFSDLLRASDTTLRGCGCTTLDGCPLCTQIGHCDRRNEALSKVAGAALVDLLQGKPVSIPFEPFIYRHGQRVKFESAYKKNEQVPREHGIGEEAPRTQGTQAVIDPYKLLRVQTRVHDSVLEKAYEVRGAEITADIPPISAVELNQAYHQVLGVPRPNAWSITAGPDPYRILEILPSASFAMTQRVYRVIARQVHPDVFPGDKAKANEMMKALNEAFDKIKEDRRIDFEVDDD